MNLRKYSRASSAISTAAVVVILIVLIVAGVAAYYYAFQPAKTTTTASTNSSSSSSSSSSTTHTVNYKSTLIVGTTDTVQSTLDPADAYDQFASDMLNNIGAGLVAYKPGTTQYVPALATTWNASTDGKIWTFNIRQGVTFPDGTTFDANAANYSVNRNFLIQEAAGPFVGAGIGSFSSVVGSEGVLNHTKVMGQYKINFYLNYPFAPFLGMMAFSAMFPVEPSQAPLPAHPHPGTSKGVINYTGTIATEAPTNGLGPYLLANWTRSAGHDVEIDFTANTHYWNYSTTWPRTQHIKIVVYSTFTALALALSGGEVDLAYRQLTATDIKSFSTNSNFKVWHGPGTFIQYLVFDQKNPAFTQQVRQAIAYALNRTAIATNVFQGSVQNLYSMIPIGMIYHSDSFKTMYGSDANVNQAKTLLTAAGYSTSHQLIVNLTYPTGHYTSTDGIAAQIAAALQATGMITVNTAAEPWSNYRISTGNDQLQAYIYGWYPDFIDPYDYTFPFFPADGHGFLHTNWVNTTITTLSNQVAGTSNPATLSADYSRIQSIVAQAAPVIPLFQGSSVAVSSTKVQGVVLDVTVTFRYFLLTVTT